jgi:hypothetical protein
MVKKPQDVTTQQTGMVKIGSVRLEPLESASVYYVNYIEVANSPQDFSLICGRLPGKLSAEKTEEAKKLGVLVIEPEVQLIIPITLVPGLIKALTIQKEKYEKLFGIQIKEVEVPHA